MLKHVAIIMDGNRRYAKQQGNSTIDGHEMGKQKLIDVIEWTKELKIDYLTV